ncbi:hypothetical protein OsJ_13040 [Oryza sativa Japonica Group]|uniref:Methyltransferase n=1 Tax=Oryza sativa subsp. japonica TaxID=39947 RepID=B9F6V8_ORYSJ|nr:hypothetical protein OsJ_13040 [Oryza sativa Japonica Group]
MWEERYENYHEIYGGEVESRTSNYADLANKYYDLVTSFYEYGWGESFHFGSRWQGETLRESLKRHEHFLALQLGLKKGMKVLDVGCGIGGPLREIARFSSASVTGLNNNAYQISRGKELNFSVGLSETCNFVKADFMNMPIPDATFDAAYAIEATCHAPDAVGVYREICRVLKPGQLFALDEWCMTDKYDPGNSRHRSIKAEIELGNGLPDIRTTKQCIQALKDAGFEVVSVKDLAEDSPLPWYLPLDSSQFSLNGFRLTRVGRFITHMLVKTLECLHVAPQGSLRVSSFLETAAEGLVKGANIAVAATSANATAAKAALAPPPPAAALALGAGAVVVEEDELSVVGEEDSGGDDETAGDGAAAAKRLEAAGAGEGASEEEERCGLRTRMLTFWPAAQWPGTPQMKKRWPAALMAILSSPEVCVAIGDELVQLS